MDNVTLKTLKFPGLDNTYVVPQDATEFSTSTAYAVGDYVIYEGVLYRFTSAHAAGAWTGSDAVATKTTDELAAQSSRIATLDELKASKEAVASNTRMINLLAKAQMDQLMEIENDSTEAYSKTLPSNTLGVLVNMIGGKSVVKNQLVPNGNFADTSEWTGIYGNVSILNNKCTYAISQLGAGINRIQTSSDVSIPIGHKILYSIDISLLHDTNIRFRSGNNFIINNTKYLQSTRIISGIFSITNGEGESLQLYFMDMEANGYSIGDEVVVGGIKIIDLTKWFDGNSTILDSITTPEDAYALGVPRDYIPYNAGEIISADCDAVDSTGFNKWDEQWETGSINHNTGDLDNSSYAKEHYMRSANYIKISPSTAYHYRAVSGIGYFLISYYDSSKNFISAVYGLGTNNNATSPQNAKYLKFAMISDYGNVYKNDICINVSQPSASITPHDGQYLPYMNDGFDIPQGLRTAHPLKSAGTAYDEYNIERKFTKVAVIDVNLGDYDYIHTESSGRHIFQTDIANIMRVLTQSKIPNFICALYRPVNIGAPWIDKDISFMASGSTRIGIVNNDYSDASSFKTSMNGVHFYYELATPIYYYDPTSPELAVNGGTVVPDATHIVDSESYFPVGSPLLNAEAGGTLTFKQTETEFPIPNSTDYFVKTTPTAA